MCLLSEKKTVFSPQLCIEHRIKELNKQEQKQSETNPILDKRGERTKEKSDAENRLLKDFSQIIDQKKHPQI